MISTSGWYLITRNSRLSGVSTRAGRKPSSPEWSDGGKRSGEVLGGPHAHSRVVEEDGTVWYMGGVLFA